MAYDNTIPKPTDSPKTSQQPIEDNFAALSTFFGVNHQNFNELNAGAHKFLQMPVQVSNPVLNTKELALFSATSPTSGLIELYLSYITLNNNQVFTPFTEGTNNAMAGYAYLPSGFIMKWGFVDLNAAQANADTEYTMSLTTPPIIRNVLWGIVVPASDPAAPNVDSNSAVYVTTLQSDSIKFKVWTRADSNTPGNSGAGALRVYGLMFGV